MNSSAAASASTSASASSSNFPDQVASNELYDVAEQCFLMDQQIEADGAFALRLHADLNSDPTSVVLTHDSDQDSHFLTEGSDASGR